MGSAITGRMAYHFSAEFNYDLHVQLMRSVRISSQKCALSIGVMAHIDLGGEMNLPEFLI